MDQGLSRKDKQIAYPSGYAAINQHSHVLQQQARHLVKLRKQVSFWRWMTGVFFALGMFVTSVIYAVIFVWPL